MWSLLFAGVIGLIGLNDQGGTVHYFDVVQKQIGHDVVLPPDRPELWAPDVGQYHSMLFLQSIYHNVGAPEALFERNQDLRVLIHLSVSDAESTHYRWEYLNREENEDSFLHDEDGHRISMYHTAWNAVVGPARPACDPKGTRPGSAGACVVYRNGEIIERNPESCKCRFATDLGHPEVREHFGDWFAEMVGPRGEGYRELAGILLDNMPVSHTFEAPRVRTGRVSGVPWGSYSQSIPHAQTYEEFLEDRRGALDHFARAVKAVDPNKIFLFNGCTILKESELDIAVDPSLIGGAIATVGDLVIDGSLRTQLHQLRAALTRGH